MRHILQNLRYYALDIRREPFAMIPCPGCGSTHRTPLLKYDRYFLPVQVSLCDACGMVYTARTISGEALTRFYREHYRRFYEDIAQVKRAYIYNSKDRMKAAYRMHRIRDTIGRFDSVLEIGSGLGYFLDECRAARIPNLLGLELGDAFATYASEELALKDVVQQKLFQEIDTLPFAPQLVVLFHVFEHLESPKELLAWLKTRIAPNGWLVIEVPNILGDWSQNGLKNFHIAHRTYFCAETLANLLAANGFTPRITVSDNTDGIYPGNLTVYAQVTTDATEVAHYPIEVPKAHIRQRVARDLNLRSLKTGYPRSLLQLARRVVRG